MPATLSSVSTPGYQITYAGVPFLCDTGTMVRMNFPPSDPSSDPEKLPPRKHQPEADLVDEINRMLNLSYLQDFSLPSEYQGRNIGALATQSQRGQDPNPGQLRLFDFYYPPTACRWGVFRGLATSSQMKAMLNATGGSLPKTFVMQAPPLGQSTAKYTVSTSMYMLPPRPLGEHGKQFDGLYLITLVDERYYWQFSSITIHPTPNTTWGSLILQLSQALGISVVNQPTVPAVYQGVEPDSQFWCNQENAAALYDAVAFNIGTVVTRNLAGQYHFLQPIASQAQINANRATILSVGRIAGGDIFASGAQTKAGNLTASMNSVLPPTIGITFPKYVMGDDPVPHFLNPRTQNPRPSTWYQDSYGDVYLVNVPLLSGGLQFSGQIGVFISGSAQLDPQGNPYVSSGLVGTSGYSPTIHSTAKALYSTEASAVSGGIPLNNSGLVSLSMQLAYDYWNAQIDSSLDEVYPGTFAWTPDGIHDLIWTYSVRMRQASLRVMRTEWNNTVDEMQHSTPPIEGGSVNQRGVGGPLVAQTLRDSYSGTVATTLNASLLSGDFSATLAAIDNLPTQNRWKGLIGSERILFEGTSGGTTVGIVYRGIDGTLQVAHNNGVGISLINPSTSYGVNLKTWEKGQFIYPGAWTSGGVQETIIVPQTQTVQVLCASGASGLPGGFYFSGRVLLYDTIGGTYQGQELCWVTDRNNLTVNSGRKYDGQFVGWSASGPVAPVYAINEYSSTGTSTSCSGSQSWDVYRMDCVLGVLKRYKQTLTLSTISGCPVLSGTAFTFDSDQGGCCLCSGSMSGGGTTDGSPCCSGQVQNTLVVTVTNKGGGCETCLPDTFAIVWDGSTKWSSSGLIGAGCASGSNGEQFNFSCINPPGNIYGANFAADEFGILVSGTCRPFYQKFLFSGIVFCGSGVDGYATITVTE